MNDVEMERNHENKSVSGMFLLQAYMWSDPGHVDLKILISCNFLMAPSCPHIFGNVFVILDVAGNEK